MRVVAVAPPAAHDRRRLGEALLREELAGLEFGEVVRVDLGERPHLDAVAPLEDVVLAHVAAALHADGADDLARGVDRRPVEVRDAHLLRRHVERRRQACVLGRDARRALVRVALQGLDAP